MIAAFFWRFSGKTVQKSALCTNHPSDSWGDLRDIIYPTTMATKISEWVIKARKRWPRSFKENEIFGDGRYAVLTCAFRHPSAKQMMYSEVHLFDTKEKALEFKAELDAPNSSGSSAYCHAKTKGKCSGKHMLVDLMTFTEES